MRRIGEPSRCSATLARLGQKHQFVHLCQQLQSCRPMPVWLTPWQEHAGRSGHPGKRVRKIPQLEPPSKPPQLSPRRVLVRLGESIWHHSEGSLVDSGLRSRKVERAVSGPGGRPRRHVLHHSQQPRKTCCQSPCYVGSTTGKC